MKSIVCIVAIIFVTACNEKSKKNVLSPDLINNPATATNEKSDKLPVITFEESRHHFGEIKAGDKVSFSFKFKNTGKADLLLSAVSPSCGCTVADWSKEPIKPNDDGHIDITFNSEGKSGMQSKTISVLSNAIPSTRVLTISADVIP